MANAKTFALLFITIFTISPLLANRYYSSDDFKDQRYYGDTTIDDMESQINKTTTNIRRNIDTTFDEKNPTMNYNTEQERLRMNQMRRSDQ